MFFYTEVSVQMNTEVEKETGSARWAYTVAALGSIVVAVSLVHRHPSFAAFVAIMGIINGIIAVSSWRNWLARSEAEKVPLRFWDQLEIKDISIPLKRDEFNQARRAAHLNLSIAAITLLYALCGILSLFSPRIPLGFRLGFFAVGIVAAWVLWHCVSRFARVSKMLTCPGCRDLLASQANSVLETGCCRKCGQTVLIN
jgi:hypothetical protein